MRRHTPDRATGTSGRDEVRQRFLALVDSIPPGRVATYGAIARWAGLPRHARLVGKTLARLPPGSPLPWHRVINATGRIPERPGGSPAEQRRLLRAEGVAVSAAGRVSLARFGISDLDAERG